MERCEFCDKWFETSFRQETNHRKHWFCCESHRSMFTMGRTLCLCCEQSSKGINQLVCNWCHKHVFRSRKYD